MTNAINKNMIFPDSGLFGSNKYLSNRRSDRQVAEIIIANDAMDYDPPFASSTI